MTKRIMLIGGFICLLPSFLLVANTGKSSISQENVTAIKDVARKVPLKSMVTISGNVTGFIEDGRYILTDVTGSMLISFHGSALNTVTQKSIVDTKIRVTGEYILDKKTRVIKVRKQEHILIL